MSKSQPLKYSMHIEWSEEDQLYLVHLPEWYEVNKFKQKYVTHGKTYEKAARNGREVIELFIESAEHGEIRMAVPKLASYEEEEEEEREWDAIVSSPHGQAVLGRLDDEARKQIAAGEVEEGGFGIEKEEE